MIESAPQLVPTFRVHIQRQIRLRRTEYVCGLVMLICGVVLLLPSDVFTNAAYSVLRSWASEGVWGVLLFLSGIIRLASLIINGARRKTTSWLRLATSSFGFLTFLVMSLGFTASGVLGLWAAIWPTLALVELANMRDTAQDARQAHSA